MLLSNTGQALSSSSPVICRSPVLDRLYTAPLGAWPGKSGYMPVSSTGRSTQLLFVPGQTNQVICRSPVLDIGSSQLLSMREQASQVMSRSPVLGIGSTQLLSVPGQASQ
jgi:hypothetical protein